MMHAHQDTENSVICYCINLYLYSVLVLVERLISYQQIHLVIEPAAQQCLVC